MTPQVGEGLERIRILRGIANHDDFRDEIARRLHYATHRLPE